MDAAHSFLVRLFSGGSCAQLSTTGGHLSTECMAAHVALLASITRCSGLPGSSSTRRAAGWTQVGNPRADMDRPQGRFSTPGKFSVQPVFEDAISNARFTVRKLGGGSRCRVLSRDRQCARQYTRWRRVPAPSCRSATLVSCIAGRTGCSHWPRRRNYRNPLSRRSSPVVQLGVVTRNTWLKT